MEQATKSLVGPGGGEDAFDERDDGDRRRSGTRPPSMAAGMAFCIPTLSAISLLYSLLK